MKKYFILFTLLSLFVLFPITSLANAPEDLDGYFWEYIDSDFPELGFEYFKQSSNFSSNNLLDRINADIESLGEDDSVNFKSFDEEQSLNIMSLDKVESNGFMPLNVEPVKRVEDYKYRFYFTRYIYVSDYPFFLDKNLAKSLNGDILVDIYRYEMGSVLDSVPVSSFGSIGSVYFANHDIYDLDGNIVWSVPTSYEPISPTKTYYFKFRDYTYQSSYPFKIHINGDRLFLYNGKSYSENSSNKLLEFGVFDTSPVSFLYQAFYIGSNTYWGVQIGTLDDLDYCLSLINSTNHIIYYDDDTVFFNPSNPPDGWKGYVPHPNYNGGPSDWLPPDGSGNDSSGDDEGLLSILSWLNPFSDKNIFKVLFIPREGYFMEKFEGLLKANDSNMEQLEQIYTVLSDFLLSIENKYNWDGIKFANGTAIKFGPYYCNDRNYQEFGVSAPIFCPSGRPRYRLVFDLSGKYILNPEFINDGFITKFKLWTNGLLLLMYYLWLFRQFVHIWNPGVISGVGGWGISKIKSKEGGS